MYRLIALDVDGTTLRPDGTLSRANREAIRRAREQGTKVVLCTGRSWQEAESVAVEAGCERYLVCQGGATLADLEERRNLREWYVDPQAGRRLLEWLEGAGVGLMVFAGGQLLVNPRLVWQLRDYNSPGFRLCRRVVESPLTVLEAEGLAVTKIYVQGDSDGQILPLRARAEQETAVDVTTSGFCNFEIMPKGVDKGTGLRALAELLSIPLSETMAIGDSENDLGMLAVSGLPVAMGNAPDRIKARARYVTASNEEDGVARAIGHFLLGEGDSGCNLYQKTL